LPAAMALRPTLADHVHRPSQLGPWVLINESWYKEALDAMTQAGAYQ
jgi:hypothetical protein